MNTQTLNLANNTPLDNGLMQVRIKHNAYIFAQYNGEMRNWLKFNEGNWFVIDTDYLFNNQYNMADLIDGEGNLKQGYRLFDSMIDCIVNDVRGGKGTCKYCGKMLNTGEVCAKHPECLEYGISWFTPENTFFLKYPEGLPRPLKELLSTHTHKVKVSTYYLEMYPELDYLRIYNGKKTINFKFDGKHYFIHNGIGWNQVKELDIPESIHGQMKKEVTELYTKYFTN